LIKAGSNGGKFVYSNGMALSGQRKGANAALIRNELYGQ
jgi:hypothetical protein